MPRSGILRATVRLTQVQVVDLTGLVLWEVDNARRFLLPDYNLGRVVLPRHNLVQEWRRILVQLVHVSVRCYVSALSR